MKMKLDCCVDSDFAGKKMTKILAAPDAKQDLSLHWQKSQVLGYQIANRSGPLNDGSGIHCCQHHHAYSHPHVHSAGML